MTKTTFVVAAAVLLFACTASAFTHVKPPPALREVSTKTDAAQACPWMLLAVQKCDSDSDWTIHGMWPQVNSHDYKPCEDCSTVPFSLSAISDLMPDINKYWPSCRHDSEQKFLQHEWSKHGTCSGFDVHGYFEAVLKVFKAGEWKSTCNSQGGNECKVHVVLN